MKLLGNLESLVYSRAHTTDSSFEHCCFKERSYVIRSDLGEILQADPLNSLCVEQGAWLSTDSGSALPNTGPDGKKQGTAYELILSVIPFMTLCKLQLSASKSSWMVHSCNHLTYFYKDERWVVALRRLHSTYKVISKCEQLLLFSAKADHYFHPFLNSAECYCDVKLYVPQKGTLSVILAQLIRLIHIFHIMAT